MKKIILEQNALVGKGKERACYVHSQDSDKVVKICHTKIKKQTKRELSIYKYLHHRKSMEYVHIPKYYGQINTNYGTGHVFDLIRDYDGTVSKSLLWYLKNGHSLSNFHKELEQMRTYLIANQIIFNHDMYCGNILFQKEDQNNGKLVIIDGLGDTVFFKLLNRFKRHRIKKIERRWDFFANRLHKRANSINSDSK